MYTFQFSYVIILATAAELKQIINFDYEADDEVYNGESRAAVLGKMEVELPITAMPRATELR